MEGSSNKQVNVFSGHGPEKSLSGIRVLDFTRAMAGPFGTMLLGDLGAEIIKVEPPQGDDTRGWAPPEINGISSYFLSANRNKKSISIDLRCPGSEEIIRRLAKSADIVVENYRPGTASRLGIGYETLSKYRNDLIYCSISGFGQTGPYSQKPGFDLTVLASSGLMGLTGEPGHPPVKFGVPITDITGGMFAVIAILSALHYRSLTGEGQYIDTSMMDSSVLTLTHQATAYFATGEDPAPMGSAHPSIAPYQVYRTADGYVSVAVGSEKLWNSLCAALGTPELAGDPMLSRNRDRVRNRKYLNSKLEPLFGARNTKGIVALLEREGIPVSPINKISDLENDPQVAERGMIREIDHPSYGRIKSLGTPFKMTKTPGAISLPPPVLGEHTMEILKALGFNEGERLELLRKRVAFQNTAKPEES